MDSYQITLSLQSAFATPLKGDTLFGQLCWAIRNRLGEERLESMPGRLYQRSTAVCRSFRCLSRRLSAIAEITGLFLSTPGRRRPQSR